MFFNPGKYKTEGNREEAVRAMLLQKRVILAVVSACILSLQSCPTLRPLGLWPARLLCPWDSSGKNTGVGCRFLLQGIFQTQGSNMCLLCLLYWQADSLPLSDLGSPR